MDIMQEFKTIVDALDDMLEILDALIDRPTELTAASPDTQKLAAALLDKVQQQLGNLP